MDTGDGKIGNMREVLTLVTVARQIDINGKQMEKYLEQCEQAVNNVHRDDLPNVLLSNKNVQSRAQKNKALAKASPHPNTAVLLAPTDSTSMATAFCPIIARSKAEEEGTERSKLNQKETYPEWEEVFALESDEESISALVLDHTSAGDVKDSAVPGWPVHSTPGNISAVPVAIGGEAPMNVGGEPEKETEEAIVSSPLMPSTHSIYSTLLCSSQPASSLSPTACTISNCTPNFAKLDINLYAMIQGPQPFSTLRKRIPFQSTMSVDGRISSSIVPITQPFITLLDLAFAEFLTGKLPFGKNSTNLLS